MRAHTTRRGLILGGLAVAAAGAGAGLWLRGTPSGAGAGRRVNTLSSAYAMQGYDPVAYVRDREPRPGRNAHEVRYDGARYRFASAANKAAFEADPARFAPAFGGYCSYGVRMGMKYDIDPSAFEVVDGRLYLQLDPGTRHIWMQNRDENILIARQIWPDIRDVPADQLPL